MTFQHGLEPRTNGVRRSWEQLGVSVSESVNYAPSAAIVRRKPQLGLSTIFSRRRCFASQGSEDRKLPAVCA